MSARERDRLKVLHEAEKGHLTQKQAGAQLKVSERWVRKLVARVAHTSRFLRCVRAFGRS